MREVGLPKSTPASEASTFRACLATILELELDEVPNDGSGDGVAEAWGLRRWLGGLGLGLVPVARAAEFSWAGPWIAWTRPAGGERRAVVMFGVPAGVVWDPGAVTAQGEWRLEDGYVVAALDIALARPVSPEAPPTTGEVVSIHVAPEAGAPAAAPGRVRALPGEGLEGDRHVTGKGTFPSRKPGSALTLIEAEVCESFEPPLTGDEHRRNVVTRGIDLNALVGHEFRIGEVRCRGMRLCEPCTVVDGYSQRALLRPLVHRGGLRADILSDGMIAIGDEVRL